MPIDYIVSYIDFSQKEIKDLYRKVVGEEFSSNVDYNYLDFTMTLRLILKNMPFINKLYITCKKEQKLPDETEELIKQSNGKIVRINENEFLPDGFVTFASNCIELFMWKIPNLSEHFIYGNDDIIPLQKMEAYEFFNDGTPVMQYEWWQPSFECMRDLHISNATNLVFDRTKNNDNYKCICFPEHTMKPLTKTICKECYDRHEKYITASLHPVRYYNGLNMDLYMLYGCKNKQICERELPYKFKYYSNSKDDVMELAEKVRRGNWEDVVCLNDGWWVSKGDKKQVKDILYKLMRIIYES